MIMGIYRNIYLINCLHSLLYNSMTIGLSLVIKWLLIWKVRLLIILREVLLRGIPLITIILTTIIIAITIIIVTAIIINYNDSVWI